MTTTELRELGAWIGLNVMGWPDYSDSPQGKNCYRVGEKGIRLKITFEPTTDPAAAMEVLKKCADKIGSCEQITIRWDDGQWVVGQDPATVGYIDESIICGETLEIAIAKYAKRLFTK